jgi:hypothetical protein
MSRQERETVVTNTPGSYGQETTTRTVTRERDVVGGPIVGENRVVQGPVTWEEMRALMGKETPKIIPTRTWKPTTGGILSILAGSWNLLLGIGAVISGTVINDIIPSFNFTTGGIATSASTGAGIFLIAIGLLAIIGGALAIMRRVWGFALIGSIAALFPTPLIFPAIMGIFALIFVTLGHLEFRGTDKAAAQR